MAKFNFKNSPLYPALIALAGTVFKQTESEADEFVAQEMKEAIEKALNYEGDIAEAIETIFKALDWAIDLNPKLAGAAWIDILMKLLEKILIAVLGNKLARVHPLRDIIRAKIQANKSIRKERKRQKKESKK